MQAEVKKLEAKRCNLPKAIEKMEENNKPQSEIDIKTAELEAAKKQLEVKWILDFRDQLQDQEGEWQMMYDEVINHFYYCVIKRPDTPVACW